MFLPLETHHVWHIEGTFDPPWFFDGLSLLTSPSDILAIGTYNAESAIYEELIRLEKTLDHTGRKPYQHSFHLSKEEFPQARAFDLPLTENVIERLKAFCQTPLGGGDKDIFFDHIVAYRPGDPVTPLLDFQDAFVGGDLYLSGHYQEPEIKDFAAVLGATAAFIVAPEWETTTE